MHQSPGGQPEGMSAYAQPQDPWAGGPEHSLASMPTEHIADSYAPHGEVWSQATVAHGDSVEQPHKRKAGMTVLVVLAALVLGGGFGYLAWYFTMRGTATPPPVGAATSTSTVTAAATPAAKANANATTAASTSAEPAAFDPHTVRVGDCLLNRGTDDDPDVEVTPCSTAKSFKVIKISTGTKIPEGPDGKFNQEVTSVAECQGTGFQSWYGYQHPTDDALDLFFCLTNNP
jgi:hypothetical protein